MLAQVVLTPTESKKLIAKAVAKMDVVRQAGLVVLHPSSSTYFVVEELTGNKPDTNFWVCGLVAPRGNCVEMAMLEPPPRAPEGRGGFRSWWVIREGRLCPPGETIAELIEQMKPTDAFIKGVNALDPTGGVGILLGDPAAGGSWGPIVSAWRRVSFSLVFPVGLEKLIPIPIGQAAQETRPAKYDYAMGLPTALSACPEGETVSKVTEVDALSILSGAVAVPVAAGGLAGAGGAVTLVVKGDESQVKKAIEFIEQSKGARLPQLRLRNCKGCPVAHCRFPVADKPWAASE